MNQYLRFLSPYLIYPLKDTFLSCSILMMVALAWERYTAIQKPLSRYEMTYFWNEYKDFIQRLKSGLPNWKILFWYISIVLFLSTCINLTKFFETSASWGEPLTIADTCNSRMETRVTLKVTSLRMNTTYVHVYSVVR